MLLCQAPQCPTSCLWYRWTLRYEPVCATQSHRCLQRLWTRGLWSYWSSTLLSVCLVMSTITSRFSSLNPRVSLVSMERVDRVVVELPTSDVAPGGHLAISPATDQFTPLNPQESQVSYLSSVQLSPNRVRIYVDIDTLDVFPVLAASPRTDGYIPLISPVSSPGSPAAGSLPDEVAASCDSTIGSLATSLSITYHAANLQLLSPPLIPLPDTVLLHADPALLLKLTQTYHDFLPPQEPVPSVDPPLGLFCPVRGRLMRQPSQLPPAIIC